MKKSCFRFVVLIQFLFIGVGLSQVPSVQLKVKTSSGFLGIGGAKYVTLRLSNQTRQLPLTSQNVNAWPYYYFECLPSGDWKLDEDIVKEILSRITVEQNTLRSTVNYVGDIAEKGDTTSVLLGFSKSLKIQQPFLFRIQLSNEQSQVQCTVPVEYWPGYNHIDSLSQRAETAFAAGDYGEAIPYFDAIVADDSLSMFPQYATAQERIVSAFQAYLDATTSAFQLLKDSTQLDPRKRIARIAGFRPRYMYVIDSLPPLRFKLGPNDSSIAGLMDRARNGVLRIGLVADSLQNALDEQTVQWIVAGSVTGKGAAKFQIMIEALAYAFSSLNFADTTGAPLVIVLPEDEQNLLDKNDLAESYKTFVRVCTERYQMHLALFPVDFLVNLRNVAAAFSNPYYSMLKAVNDYYAGNLTSCREDILAVFRTCSIRELLSRFDLLRVIVNSKLNHIPENVIRLINEGETLESKGDITQASEKLRQAVILAPEYAEGALALGKLSISAGDTTAGLGLLQKAYQRDTLFLSAYLESCDVFLQQKNYQSMISTLSTAIANRNDYWVINSMLGEAYLNAGEPRRAVAALQRAAELNPQSYETCMELGRAYQAARDFLKARESFNKAIELDAMRKEAVDALNKLNEVQHSHR